MGVMSDQSNITSFPRRPEKPRVEPEIIPPGAEPRSGWYSAETMSGVYRIYVARPGPFAMIAAMIIAALIGFGIFLLVVGTVIVWVPIIAAVIGGLMLYGYLRGSWRRWRGRMAQRG
jgi:hypothetical protein